MSYSGLRGLGFVLNRNQSAHGTNLYKKDNRPKRNAKRKFTAEEVRAIRKDRRSDKELAEELGVKAQTIYQIRVGLMYSWVV